MPAGGFFKIVDTVDSTNNYAMEKVHAGLANHGMAWFANDQTAGKGQRGGLGLHGAAPSGARLADGRSGHAACG